ncbi:hypothetical protein M9194_18300 [Vibrio sp. S4M6]|uniref:hypothetical protein n=1 Tax=Vibrio sinus TaxID=2946865 RepID=UPI00202A0006|nr:hypothetical protein [Vibrio sinus]MCL9783384.1 hypothetical protein [Vibrio sinus]
MATLLSYIYPLGVSVLFCHPIFNSYPCATSGYPKQSLLDIVYHLSQTASFHVANRLSEQVAIMQDTLSNRLIS